MGIDQEEWQRQDGAVLKARLEHQTLRLIIFSLVASFLATILGMTTYNVACVVYGAPGAEAGLNLERYHELERWLHEQINAVQWKIDHGDGKHYELLKQQLEFSQRLNMLQSVRSRTVILRTESEPINK